MTTVQPPSRPAAQRSRIVLDHRFYAVRATSAADVAGPAREPARRSPARVWHVVLLAMTALCALAMIVFALLKEIPSTALCMLALVVVKAADHWTSRRLRHSQEMPKTPGP